MIPAAFRNAWTLKVGASSRSSHGANGVSLMSSLAASARGDQFGGGMGRSAAGDFHAENSPLPWFALDAARAAQCPQVRFHDVEPQPQVRVAAAAARRLGPIKWLEQVGQVLGRNARPGVPH